MKYSSLTFAPVLVATLLLVPFFASADVSSADPDGDGIASATCVPAVVCGTEDTECVPQPESCTTIDPPTGDNCPNVANADQADADGDQVGDVCDQTPNGEAVLHVVVSVVNDQTGGKIPSDVTVHVNPGPETPVIVSKTSVFSRLLAYFGAKIAHADAMLAAPATFAGSDTGTDVSIGGNGSYRVSIDQVVGYSVSFDECKDGTVAPNSVANCTISLNDQYGNGFGSYPSLPTTVDGCTDPVATNFRAQANHNDGSCQYATSTGMVLGASTTIPDLPLPKGCSPFIKAYLKQGRKNDVEEVKKLQQTLNETFDANLPVTGFFGSLTKKWVKKYQTKFETEILKPWIDAGYGETGGLAASGYAFITTRRHINISKCDDLRHEPMPKLVPDPNP